MRQLSKQQGFTLIELIVVVAITAIIAAIGGSSYSYISKKKQIEDLAANIEAGLSLARAMAYDSGRTVTICPVADISVVAGQDSACSANWNIFNTPATRASSGWAIFHDQDNDGNIDNAGNNERLYEIIPFGKTSQNTKVDFFTIDVFGAVASGTGGIQLGPLGSNGTTGNLFIRVYNNANIQPWSNTINSSNFENRVTINPLGMLSVSR